MSKNYLFKIPLSLKLLIALQISVIVTLLNKEALIGHIKNLDVLIAIEPSALLTYLALTAALLMVTSAIELKNKVNHPLLSIKKHIESNSITLSESELKAHTPEIKSIFNSISDFKKDKKNIEFLKDNLLSEVNHLFLISDRDNKIVFISSCLKNALHSQSREVADILTLTNGECVEYKEQGTASYYVVKTSSIQEDGQTYKLTEMVDVTQRINLSKKLKEKSNIDELTSVLTRFSFTEYAENYKHSLASDQCCFLSIVDINDFKLINDSAGHHIGDIILMELSNIMRSLVPEEEVIGRLSGDEFVILFKSSSRDYVESVLSSIYNAIKDYRIEHCDTHLSIGISIGISILGDEYTDTVQQCLQEADFAAMTAKKNSSTFKFYSTSDNEVMYYKEAPIWIDRIKSAIRYNNFSLFVQEINPTSNTLPRHLEVLLRMKDGKGGYFPPYKFFDVAERFELMRDIDEWVVSNTFKSISEGLISQKLSINLSGDSIKDRKLISKIITVGDYYSISTQDVIFEITVTMAIDDLDGAIENIIKLKEHGYSVSLDDFGSGFSTFKYIQCIPADYLKIDGIFIKNLTTSQRDKAIVSNIIQIAHELDMKCVAEFVENKETATLLNDMGVDYLQGYYLHKPEPMEDWTEKAYENHITA